MNILDILHVGGLYAKRQKWEKIRFLHYHDGPVASMAAVMRCQEAALRNKRTKMEEDVPQQKWIVIWMASAIPPHLMMDGSSSP